MTAIEFLKVRDAIVDVVKQKTQSTKTTDIAEDLMQRGWIDVDAVRATFPPAAGEAEGGPDA